MKSTIACLMFILLAAGAGFDTAAQTIDSSIRTAVLESRRVDRDTGHDNYEYAVFSFLHGMNGPSGTRLTRNNWDVMFSTTGRGERLVDYFDVTMVVDDRSRIIDLGQLEWKDAINLPELPAYEKPTRETRVEAVVGHLYYVHTADRDLDHYSLFRVEGLESGKWVSISWKLVAKSAEGSKQF